MQNRINILDVLIDNVDMKRALDKVDSFLNQDELKTIYTPNSEIMMEAQTDEDLKKILNKGSLVIPDGAGVVLAARILGYKMPGRLAGYDLVEAMLERYAPLGKSVFLLGARPEINEAAAINIVGKYKGIRICGYHHGYFKDDETPAILEKINSSDADILLVGLGAPKQEKWIYENMSKINVNVAMGVGGSFDGFAGSFPRAPEFFRKNNLEWLYRLYKEPKRFFRMLRIPKFLIRVIKRKLFGR